MAPGQHLAFRRALAGGDWLWAVAYRLLSVSPVATSPSSTAFLLSRCCSILLQSAPPPRGVAGGCSTPEEGRAGISSGNCRYSGARGADPRISNRSFVVVSFVASPNRIVASQDSNITKRAVSPATLSPTSFPVAPALGEYSRARQAEGCVGRSTGVAWARHSHLALAEYRCALPTRFQQRGQVRPRHRCRYWGLPWRYSACTVPGRTCGPQVLVHIPGHVRQLLAPPRARVNNIEKTCRQPCVRPCRSLVLASAPLFLPSHCVSVSVRAASSRCRSFPRLSRSCCRA